MVVEFEVKPPTSIWHSMRRAAELGNYFLKCAGALGRALVGRKQLGMP